MTKSIGYPCQGRRNNDGLGSGSHGKGRAEAPKIVFTPKQKMRDAANKVELSIDRGTVTTSSSGSTSGGSGEGNDGSFG